MKIYVILRAISFTVLVLGIAPPCLAEAWRGIVPMHSTRADVESVLGPPIEPGESIYDTNDERIYVAYSKDTCVAEGTPDRVIPPGTVLLLRRSLKKMIPIKNLAVDLSKFRRERDPHMFEHFHYFDDDRGLQVSSVIEGETEQVYALAYVPAAKDAKYHCGRVSLPSTRRRRSHSGSRSLVVPKDDPELTNRVPSKLTTHLVSLRYCYGNELSSVARMRLQLVYANDGDTTLEFFRGEPQVHGYWISKSEQHAIERSYESSFIPHYVTVELPPGVAAPRPTIVSVGPHCRFEAETEVNVIFAMPGEVPLPGTMPPGKHFLQIRVDGPLLPRDRNADEDVRKSSTLTVLSSPMEFEISSKPVFSSCD